MSILFKDNPIKKQEYILNLAASGKSNKEIAEELGYKDVGNLYTFMRRRGMGWNAKKGIFVVKGKEEEVEAEAIEVKPSGKVGSIISMFEKKMDGREIANRLRFGSYQEMADYMKSKGYAWDNKKQNYKRIVVLEVEPIHVNMGAMEQSAQINASNQSNKVNQCNYLEKYADILNLLETKKDKILEMLKVKEEESCNIPRYTLPGYTAQKSLSMISTLERLIKEFSEDKNISQKEIIEVAVVEFLKKYGYVSQVKAVLHV